MLILQEQWMKTFLLSLFLRDIFVLISKQQLLTNFSIFLKYLLCEFHENKVCKLFYFPFAYSLLISQEQQMTTFSTLFVSFTRTKTSIPTFYFPFAYSLLISQEQLMTTFLFSCCLFSVNFTITTDDNFFYSLC